MSEHANNSKSEASIGMRAMEIITALLFLVFGLVVMVGSIKLGASWGSDGPEAGYFPVLYQPNHFAFQLSHPLSGRHC
jgi:hypothetical protein